MKINKNGLVIVQSTLNISYERMMRYRQSFLRDIESGLLVIPPWFHVVYVPEGVEVKVEDLNEQK